MLISLEDASGEAQRLDRTIGFPKDHDARGRLVVGLMNACHRHGVAPDRVVSKCLEMSQHCPTDYDFFKIAESLREFESWKPREKLKCTRCNDTGFETIFMLHTREGHGEHSYVKKERITRDAFDSFSGGKLDPHIQSVFCGARKCDHQDQPEPEWTDETRRAHDARWQKFVSDVQNGKLSKGKTTLAKRLIGALR